MNTFKMRYLTIVKLLTLLTFFAQNSAFAEKQATIIFDAEMSTINDAKNGSYAQLATLIDDYREKSTSTFFIFGGESLGPSMLSSMDRGAHIIDVLNSLEPNAMGVSKREFSYQEDELILRTYEAAFPIVSSNLYDPISKQSPEGIEAYTLLKQGEVKLGFISILDPIVTEKYPTKRLVITPPLQAVLEIAKLLRKQNVDLIVLHYSTFSPVINQLLEQGIIDLALFEDQNFHSNTYLNSPRHPNNLVLAKKSDTAVIQLTWQPDHPHDSLVIEEISVDLTSLPAKPKVLQLEEEYDNRLNSLLNEVIGKTDTQINLQRKVLRTSENGFANLVTDTLKDFTDAQIALINSGTLRSEKILQAGSPLTVRDIRAMLPYRNTLQLIEATGQQIMDALEHGLSKLESQSGQFLQVAGIKVTYDSSRPIGKRLISVTLNKQPLQPKQIYKVVSLDYLINGGDGFTMFKNSKALTYKQTNSLTLSDIMSVEIHQKKVIAPKIDGRLKNLAVEN
ncbi:bifunctional UDP-sugar hydrolase/5'-nucleotidase [Marinomonas polaris]|uniref:bifunctional metallophosphatase/5'-nucleotidase n=1 Tax=Marinomonas polaris TaxID=293552 RepID=UPI0035140CCB